MQFFYLKLKICLILSCFLLSFNLSAAHQCLDLFSSEASLRLLSEELFLKEFRKILGIKVDAKKILSARLAAQKEVIELEDMWKSPYSAEQRQTIAFDFFRQSLSEQFHYVAYGPEQATEPPFVNRSLFIDAFTQTNDSSMSQALQKSRIKLTDFWFEENSANGLHNPIQNLSLSSVYSFYIVRHYFEQSARRKEMATLRVLKRSKEQPTISELVMQNKGIHHTEFQDFLRHAEEEKTSIYEIGRVSNAISNTRQISHMFRLILYYEFAQREKKSAFILSVKNHPKLIEYYKKWGFREFAQGFQVDGVDYILMTATAKELSSVLNSLDEKH